MARWLDVRFQLVDLPPVSPEFTEPWLPGIVRSADAALLVDGPRGRRPGRRRRRRPWAGSRRGGSELVGELPFDSEDETVRHVKTAVVANKADAEGAADRLAILREWYEGPVSGHHRGVGDRGRGGRRTGLRPVARRTISWG